jgi:hypothetical protein
MKGKKMKKIWLLVGCASVLSMHYGSVYGSDGHASKNTSSWGSKFRNVGSYVAPSLFSKAIASPSETKKNLEHAGNVLKDHAATLGNATKSYWGSFTDKAGSMLGAVGSGLGYAKDSIGSGLGYARDSVGSGLGYARDSVGSGLGYAKDSIGSGLGYAKDSIGSGLGYARDSVGSGLGYAKDSVGSGMSYAGQSAQSGLGYVGSGMKNLGSSAWSYGSNAAGWLSQSASSLYNSVYQSLAPYATFYAANAYWVLPTVALSAYAGYKLYQYWTAQKLLEKCATTDELAAFQTTVKDLMIDQGSEATQEVLKRAYNDLTQRIKDIHERKWSASSWSNYIGYYGNFQEDDQETPPVDLSMVNSQLNEVLSAHELGYIQINNQELYKDLMKQMGQDIQKIGDNIDKERNQAKKFELIKKLGSLKDKHLPPIS